MRLGKDVSSSSTKKGRKFDWDNDNLSNLEVADEQPKLTDPGVADIPVEEMYEEDKPKKPTHITRAVAVRENAGIDREQEPSPAGGVAERAHEKEDKVEDYHINYNFEPVTAQNGHKETPKAVKEEETLGRGKHKRTQRAPFSPTMKGQYHKDVRFVEASEEIGKLPRKTEDSIQAGSSKEFNSAHVGDLTGTDTRTTRKGDIEQKLDQLMEAWAKQGQLAAKRDEAGRKSQGRKDPGVGHPPRN